MSHMRELLRPQVMARARKVARWALTLPQRDRFLKYLLGFLLQRAGLCHLLTIERGLYRLRFWPTALSLSLWVYPDSRWEDEEVFCAYLRRGDNVVDIGANIGSLTLTAAALVSETGKVYAFEPHPGIFRYLQANVELNEFDNVISLFNVAVGSSNGVVSLSDKNDDDQNDVVYEGGMEVPVRRLDDLLASHRSGIDLLKVDAEGYELFVFQGARDILARTSVCYFESWDVHFSKYDYTSRDLQQILSSAGFALFEPCLGRRSIRALSERHTSVSRENLLALRDPQEFIAKTGFRLD